MGTVQTRQEVKERGRAKSDQSRLIPIPIVSPLPLCRLGRCAHFTVQNESKIVNPALFLNPFFLGTT
jgi:hypothetical protein